MTADEPRGFIDASLRPLERALLHRADYLTSGEGIGHVEAEVRKQLRIHGASPGLTSGSLAGTIAAVIAAEFRALAAELRQLAEPPRYRARHVTWSH